MIDDNQFYREATMRICSSLRLEQALQDTFLYLRHHLPADALFMEYFDPSTGLARTVAQADDSGGERLDVVIPLHAEAQNEADFQDGVALRQAVIMNRPDENEMVTGLMRFYRFDETATSLINLQLLDERTMFGGLVVVAKQRDAFSERHAHLITLLAEPFKVALINAMQHREVIRLRDKLADDNRFLHRQLRHITGDEIIGADFGLREVMRQVRKVASTESPVLLTGETGVGKDVIANAIHLGSPRRDGPFIPVNCGAIPQSLIDSELFGHEKGAFTGALSQKRGRFERADQGTILLDEIGEMPLEAQVRLLRVLQNREIERIGGSERIVLNIRVIAATNRSLPELVTAGRFREDLLYRLNVFPIDVPPLRERIVDIPALVQYFIDRKSKSLKIGETPRLADGALDMLTAYRWPGNVRELENVVERAMILHRGEPLDFAELGVKPQRTSPEASAANSSPSLALDVVVTQHIKRVLDMTQGQIHGPGGAAEILKVNPSTLRTRMEKLGILVRKAKTRRGSQTRA